MNLHPLALHILLAILTAVISLPAAADRAKSSPEAFNLKAEPGKRDWQNFLRADEKTRAKLWSYHVKKGYSLKDWSWGWRLGWVRSCTYSTQPYCRIVLKQALFDRALVVRAECAKRLGLRYENTKNEQVINLLISAYKDKRNLRNHKPMFVQNRILYALRQIGGPEALASAARLAKAHPHSHSYWQRLSAVDPVPVKASAAKL